MAPFNHNCHGRARRTARRLAAEQDGVVLIWALIVTFVLMVSTASAIQLVTSNEQAFGRDTRSTSALAIAEAGIAAATGSIEAAADTTTSMANHGTLQGGTWSYTAARTQDSVADSTRFTWTITSTGVLGPTTHTVRITLAQTVVPGSQTQTITVPSSAAYGYGMFLGAAASDCTTSGANPNQFSGSGTASVNVYTNGSLCFSGGSNIQEPSTSTGNTVTVYVGGKLASSGETAFAGTTTKYLKQVTVVGGCYDQNHGLAVSCNKKGSPVDWTGGATYGSGVYANVYSSTQNTIAKPTVSTSWYTNAAPGPVQGCNGNSTFPSNQQSGTPQWSATTFNHTVFDGDSTRNSSIGTIDFTQLVNNWNNIMNSFDCKFYSGSTLLGELKWTYPSGGMSSSNPGTLYINGTVYIDGNLSFGSSDYILYQGVGTIYVNGTVNFGNGAKFCAKPISGSPCLGNFDNTQNLIELVAVNAGNASSGWTMSGAGTYEGIAYTNGAFNAGNGAQMNGPVVADTALMSGAMNLRSTWNPPSGAPGAASTTTTTTSGPDQVSFAANPGSWQQLG